MNLRTRNFNLSEIINNYDGWDPKLLPIATTAMGTIQMLRDYLCFKYQKQIRIKITSGYRSAAYNATLSGASSDSYHIWRFEDDGYMRWALDFTSPDLSLEELFKAVKEVYIGETYMHRRFGFIHISSQKQDEEWTI